MISIAFFFTISIVFFFYNGVTKLDMVQDERISVTKKMGKSLEKARKLG